MGMDVTIYSMLGHKLSKEEQEIILQKHYDISNDEGFYGVAENFKSDDYQFTFGDMNGDWVCVGVIYNTYTDYKYSYLSFIEPDDLNKQKKNLKKIIKETYGIDINPKILVFASVT